MLLSKGSLLKGSFGSLEKLVNFSLEDVGTVSLGTGLLDFTGAFGRSSPFFLFLKVTCVHSLSVFVFSASGVALVVLFPASFGYCMVSAVFRVDFCKVVDLFAVPAAQLSALHYHHHLPIPEV